MTLVGPINTLADFKASTDTTRQNTNSFTLGPPILGATSYS